MHDKLPQLASLPISEPRTQGPRYLQPRLREPSSTIQHTAELWQPQTTEDYSVGAVRHEQAHCPPHILASSTFIVSLRTFILHRSVLFLSVTLSMHAWPFMLIIPHTSWTSSNSWGSSSVSSWCATAITTERARTIKFFPIKAPSMWTKTSHFSAERKAPVCCIERLGVWHHGIRLRWQDEWLFSPYQVKNLMLQKSVIPVWKNVH